jgi:hypothetical protein
MSDASVSKVAYLLKILNFIPDFVFYSVLY